METLHETHLQTLQAIAEREHRSINAVLEDMLSQYQARSTLSAEREAAFALPQGSLERLAAFGRLTAQSLLEDESLAGTENVAENADEILRTEYADYLLARMNRPAIDNDESNSA